MKKRPDPLYLLGPLCILIILIFSAYYPGSISGPGKDTVNRISTNSPLAVIPSFSAPDTVCVNTSVNITNTTTGASSFYWNFCVADINQSPQGTNLGNPGNNLSMPVFMDYVRYNNNYYGFLINYSPGGLIRLDFGNSLLNTPTSVNLGNFGDVIPTADAAEGIRVVQNEGKWYAIIVGGFNGGPPPRVVKIDFGADLTNTNPVATNWGNVGNMDQPIDFDMFQENGNWYGFTVSADNNTITRFNFTNSFDNTPTAVNLGNVGQLAYPTGLYIINDNGINRIFITNAGNVSRNSGVFSLTRLDFGNSLLNTPVGVNLGNPGNLLQHPRDLTIMRSCGQIVGFAVNGHLNDRNITKLDFNSDLSSVPSAVSLGNIGNLSFSHSISRLFRVNEDIYGFVTNVDNSTITRLHFAGCTNASIPSSSAQHPPAITYNTPGTYNINLLIDDGLPTQSALCKQIVVVPAQVPQPVRTVTLCPGGTVRIGTGLKGSYSWNTGAAMDSVVVNAPGTYWVDVSRYGCSVRESINVVQSDVAAFSFRQDVCDPLSIRFDGETSDAVSYHWDFGNGVTVTGNPSPVVTYGTYGSYDVKLTVRNTTGCVLDVTKRIQVQATPDNVIVTGDTIGCENTQIQLRGAPALAYCWFPAAGLSAADIADPVTTPLTEDRTYYLNAEVVGSNLIVNGDFSAGNTGFTSAYQYASSGIPEATYFVGPAPRGWHGGMANCGDHTAGNGNMMMVNGAVQSDVDVWSQTISIQPNSSYAFSTWLQSIGADNPAQLQFSINGKPLGNIFQANYNTCEWRQFYTVWNSGSNTSAVISIMNMNQIANGNDFALDDISFAPVYIRRDSVKISMEKPTVRTGNDTTVCAGSAVPFRATGAATYAWTPVTGLSDPAIGNPVLTPAATGEYIVTGTTANGCMAKDTINISLFAKPPISRTSDTMICRSTPAQLYAGGGVSYTWYPSASLSDPGIANPVALPAVATKYYVEVTDAHSCTYLDSVQVNMIPSPVFAAIPDTGVCSGNVVKLRAEGGDLYQWAPVTGLDDASSSSPILIPSVTTQYEVHITENRCNYDTTIQVLVTVNPGATVTAWKENDIDCSHHIAQLHATGGNQYAWSPASAVDDPLSANPVARIDTTTIFTVTATNQYGCSSVNEVTVHVTSAGKIVFSVPNAFSPNNDGINDCFGIRKWGSLQLEELSVFSRWGEQVFSTKDPMQCWDGTYKGKPLNTGTFVYLIRAQTICGPVIKKGTLTLIR
jgi:gliding motility-associated-like protein